MRDCGFCFAWALRFWSMVKKSMVVCVLDCQWFGGFMVPSHPVMCAFYDACFFAIDGHEL